MKPTTVILNILKTIAAVPLSLIGAILLTPIVLIYLLFALPLSVIGDIWMEN